MLASGETINNLFGTDCQTPVFTTNWLFLHFSLWFLHNGQSSVPIENNQTALKALTSYVSKLIDVRQLDFSGIAAVYPSLNLQQAFNGKDEFLKQFWAEVVSTFRNTEQLMLSSIDPNDIIFSSLEKSLSLGNVSFVQLMGPRYDNGGFTLDTKPVPTTNPKDVQLVLSLKDTEFLHVIRPYFERLKKNISLHVIVTGMENCLDLTNFMTPDVAKLHVSCNNTNNCKVVVTPIRIPCPNLTVLHIHGLSLNDTVAPNLSEAISSKKLPRLGVLNLEYYTQFSLSTGFTSLCSTPWPTLDHLGLNGSFLDHSNFEILSKHNRLFPKLTSLQLFLCCASDKVQRKEMKESQNKYICIERDIDAPLSKLFSVPWRKLTELWLYEMNKIEYKNFAHSINEGKLPNLRKLGISMWALVDDQKMKEIPLKVKGRSTIVGKLALPDWLPPVNVKTLTDLTMHRFVCSMYHLDMVTQSKVFTQLHKLDISHVRSQSPVLLSTTHSPV